MYIVYGNTYEIISSKLLTMFPDDTKFVNFDWNSNKVSEIQNTLMQQSLFEESDNVVYVIKKATFLNSDSKSTHEFIENLLKINKNIICTLVLKKKVNLSENITKNKNIKIIKATNFTDKEKNDFVKNLLNKYPINFDCETTKENFIDLLPMNRELILTNIKKLNAYSLDNIVNESIINNTIFIGTDNNIYNLLNLIISNNISESLTLFDKLLKTKIQPITIVQVLLNQLFELKIQKKFITNYDLNTSYEIIKLSPYIIKKNIFMLRTLSINRIDELINKLIVLEYNIKLMKIIPVVGIKQFILEGTKNGK